MLISNLDRFLHISDAAEQLNMSEGKLRALIKNGKIRAAILPSGEIGVSEQDTQAHRPTAKEELSEYKKHIHLKGTGIGINEAAKKYGISFSTIRGWASRDFIKTLRQDGQKILLDEADVAYCVEVYRNKEGGQGRWIFNEDGTPYEKTKYPVG